MYKTIWIFSVFLCLHTTVFTQSRITYNEYFDYNKGYCEGDSQYDHWVDFLDALDTLSDKYIRMRISGTFDMTGKTCSDKYAVRQIADALNNRYDASVYCDGTYWNVGNGCSDFNCGSSDGYVELTLNTSTCNCGVSYTIRPGNTSPNWGGIATETCQWSAQNASQNMRVDVDMIDGNDNLSLQSLQPFDECRFTQDIQAVIANYGENSVGNYRIGYSINGALQTPLSISGTIDSDATALVLLYKNFVFTANTTYHLKVWTYDPNNMPDPQGGNDTLYMTYLHTGHPDLPLAADVTSCGVGPAILSAVSGDPIAWYDAPTGGNMLGTGSDFRTPFLRRNDTFYAESFRFKESHTTFGTGFNNYTTLSENQAEYNGGMMSVTVSEVLNISGIKVQSFFKNPTPHYKVYIRESSFASATTDSSTWKRVFDAELANGGLYNTIPVDIVLSPGIDYGIYITSDPVNGEDIWMNFGVYNYANSDISVTGGVAVYGKFGSVGVYEPWTIDAEFIYEKACRSLTRQPVKVTVNPRPFGAELQPDPASSGLYRSGFASDPDIAEPGMRMVYDIKNPDAYTSPEHDISWLIDSVSLSGAAGTRVPQSMYGFVFPDAASNGSLYVTPDKSWVDSTITVRVRLKDLGPYFCDTTITRVIHVAPVPEPAFKVLATICEGSEIYFNNLSSIHSGRMSYKWFFTAKDSSDIFEPIHQFDSFGVYPVRLEVTSIPYGIKRDTIILVNINNNPKVDFKVENVCEGRAVNFTNLTSGSGVSFKWDFGDRTPVSSVLNPTHLYALPDVYQVTLKADLNGCVSSVTKNAYTFARPLARFQAPATPVCQNEPVLFTNMSSIAGGNMGALWEFGDSAFATLFNVSHQFPRAGMYKVRLKMISEFGCEDSMETLVALKPISEADFAVDKLCSRDSTHFTNLSVEFPGIAASYTWTFDDGTPKTTRHISRSWNTHGPKTVVLKTELSNGCVSRLERQLDVLIQPDAKFSVRNICSGEAAEFVNLSRIEQGAVTYYWDFGDLEKSVVDHPRHVYHVDTTTFYHVMLVADAFGGCADTAETNLRVYRLPSCNFTYKPFHAIGNRAFVFIPEDDASTEYEWLFGEGGSSTSPSPIYQFLYSGNYEVRLKAKNAGGCICEQLIKVNVFLSGVDDLEHNLLSVYPNPADQSMTIELSDGKKGMVNIYNDLGQLVHAVYVDAQEVFQTHSFQAGLYLMEVITDDGRKSLVRFTVIH